MINNDNKEMAMDQETKDLIDIELNKIIEHSVKIGKHNSDLDLDFKFNKVEENDDGTVTVMAFGSTFDNVNSRGSYMTHGCWDKCLQNLTKPQDIKIFFEHDAKNLLTSATNVFTNNEGLVVEFNLKPGIDIVDRVIEYIKRGDIEKMSVGFILEDYKKDYRRKALAFTECNLFEISCTSIPVNDKAKFINVQGIDPRTLEHSIRDVEGISFKDAKAIVSKLSEQFGRDVQIQNNEQNVQPDEEQRDVETVSSENKTLSKEDGQRDVDDDAKDIGTRFLNYLDKKENDKKECADIKAAFEESFKSFYQDDQISKGE